MSEPKPSSDTNIQSEKPLPAEAAIQATRPAAAVPPSLPKSAFLGRMRRLLEMHNEMSATKPKPGMWGAIQLGGMGFGGLLGFSAYKELIAAQADTNLAGVVFVLLMLAGTALPDVMLKVIRKAQFRANRDRILDFIEKTLRNYPDEVEQCGGPRVLADRVELEALVRVLQETFPLPSETPLPPLQP